MFKSLHYSIGLSNRDNLLIVKFRNSKFDLKDNLVNNKNKSNACRFLNFYPLKGYEVRRLKNYLGGQILYRSLVPSKKRRH